MAAQFESGNQLQEFLGILARRKWQILVPTLYVLSIGIAVAAFLPRVYIARAQVNLFPTRVEDAAFSGDPLAASGARETTNAQAQVTQDNRIRKVLDDLEWPDYLQLDEGGKYEYRTALKRRISVHVREKARNEGSTFVDLAFQAGEPRRAEAFLQQLIDLWLKDVYERDEMNRRRERDVLQDQRAELQLELRQLTDQFADKLKASGLSPDQFGGTQRFVTPPDPLAQRIAAADAALLQAERLLKAQRARVELLERELENAPVTLAESAEVGAESNQAKIDAIQDQISLERTKQTGLKRLHPRFAVAEDEIRRLEQQIETLRGRERRGEIVLKPAPNPMRDALEADLSEARLELVGLEQDVAFYTQRLEDDRAAQSEQIDLRLQLEELRAGLDSRQATLDEIERKYVEQQQSLQILQRATQLYEVTEEARSSNEPAWPNVPLVWFLSLLGGLGLGLAVAGVAEFTQAGYRTPSDLARALGVPVLGVIQEVPTAADRRARLVRHSVVLVSTLAVLGGLHWFVWTWSRHPERLDTDVVRAIEDVREQFR